MAEDNCIFCKIARGVIPSTTVYEDEDFRVILDLAMNHSSSSHPWFQQAAEQVDGKIQQQQPESQQAVALKKRDNRPGNQDKTDADDRQQVQKGGQQSDREKVGNLQQP